ncbi:MAG: ligand-gated TonB-dependent outer rane channel [Planctomycetaceae bacterium]|nr:ligand-gated TonB-dependent outer rane channel [Planctomycetaceae bacterium]
MLTWPHISYRRLHLSLTVLILGIPSALLAQAPETELKREDPSEIQDATDGPADPSGKVKGLETATPDKAAAPLDILDLDIEQLGKVQAKVATAFDVEVTSVTANKSSVGKSPAAVFVITNDMIRRSGATSIPETFRMVPGMQVAKVGSSKWAISARGFNQQFSNKLLVLVDGRSVYTQFFGGVYWETQDLVLQDIDRIEVIRGPGATVWGANAVNGVINIITKSAGATQGTLLSSGGGTQDRSINVIRQGGKIGDNGEYKVYLKHTERAEGFNPVKDVDDDWRTVRGGFRVDWNDPCQQDQFTLQGDAYSGVIGERSAFPASLVPFVDSTSQNSHMGGANVLGRWSHNVDDDNTYSIQAYVDRTLRQDTLFNLAINVYDLQFQQNIKHSGNHTFTWGTGYRVVADDIRGRTSVPVVSPESLTFNQSTLFAQEELPVLRDDLRLLVGTKLLLNDFTGFEYQPTTRLLWDIDDTQAAWGAISRAVRTPSRSEEDLNLKLLSLTPFPSIYSLKGGGSSLVAEDLMAYELGYRHQVNDRFSFELATFCNIYRNLIIPDAAGLIPGLPPTILARYRNGQNAETYGFELNGQWEIHEKWRLRAWYSLLIMQIHGRPGTDTDPAGQSPVNQAYFMSSWDLPRNFEFDLMGRYVDNLPSIKVPSYTTMDARLGWRPKTNWEFSIIGQNLLAPHHLESGAELTLNSAVNRGVYGQVTWRH